MADGLRERECGTPSAPCANNGKGTHDAGNTTSGAGMRAGLTHDPMMHVPCNFGVGATHHTPFTQSQLHSKPCKRRSKPQQNMPNHNKGGVSAQRVYIAQ